jgi:hypothetical protein
LNLTTLFIEETNHSTTSDRMASSKTRGVVRAAENSPPFMKCFGLRNHK